MDSGDYRYARIEDACDAGEERRVMRKETCRCSSGNANMLVDQWVDHSGRDRLGKRFVDSGQWRRWY